METKDYPSGKDPNYSAMYGRHLRGVTLFPKTMGFFTCRLGTQAALSACVDGVDYVVPVPIVSQDTLINSVQMICQTAGAAGAKVRGALYECNEDGQPGKLCFADIVDGDAAPVGIEFAGPYTLKRGQRYVWIYCGYNGGAGALPCVLGWTYALPTWFGNCDGIESTPIGMQRYTRAYAAFPDPYTLPAVYESQVPVRAYVSGYVF